MVLPVTIPFFHTQSLLVLSHVHMKLQFQFMFLNRCWVLLMAVDNLTEPIYTLVGPLWNSA